VCLLVEGERDKLLGHWLIVAQVEIDAKALFGIIVLVQLAETVELVGSGSSTNEQVDPAAGRSSTVDLVRQRAQQAPPLFINSYSRNCYSCTIHAYTLRLHSP